MKNFLIVCILCLTIGIILSGCSSGEQTTSDDIRATETQDETTSPDVRQDLGLQKFAIINQGEEIGYKQIEVELYGNDSLITRELTSVTTAVFGEERVFETNTYAVSDLNYNLGRIEIEFFDGTSEHSVKAFRHDSLLITEDTTVEYVIADSIFIGQGALCVSADLVCASLEWIEGQERTIRGYDPISQTITSLTAKCHGYEEVDFLGDTVQATQVLLSQTGNRNVVLIYMNQIVKEYNVVSNMQLLRISSDQEEVALNEAPFLEEYFLSNSEVWYSSELKEMFPDGIELLHVNYSLDELPCIPIDITDFSMSAQLTGNIVPAFEIAGSFSVNAIPTPFEAYNGENYLLSLNAFLINSNGEIVWSQDGFPYGEAWISVEGSICEFRLIGGYNGPIDRHQALVIVSGDPIRTPGIFESRVVLGVGVLNL